jgi:hypothetical protein
VRACLTTMMMLRIRSSSQTTLPRFGHATSRKPACTGGAISRARGLAQETKKLVSYPNGFCIFSCIK